jgi:SulP family sulfate permease
VLGVQSVPDGLATGLLAGANPLTGLYGYLVGTIAGACVTSSAFMAVQGTGAMAIIIADVPAIGEASDPERALFTLAVMTGIVMLAAGLLRLGSLLRFVSNTVMVGFISAVGLSIILGQLANFTGYEAAGDNRIERTINTVLHPGQLDPETLAIGAATVILIVALEKTRLKALGLVVAVIVTSAATSLLGWGDVATLADLGVVPDSLPTPELPLLQAVPSLIVPALALTFVALVQGAGISATFPNPDGKYPDASRDFIGQGAANIASGLLRGMPVGGSLSATALNKAAGAQSRYSLLVAGAVMAIVIVAFGEAIGNVAMPALAGLLMLVGYRTIDLEAIRAVWHTGTVQRTVVAVTFVLTLLLPLQYAVMVGVALSLILHVARQSSRITLRRRIVDEDGRVIETEPPEVLPANDVVLIQPYGSLFFASAPAFEAGLPEIREDSRNSVVLLRLRGRNELGSTFADVLFRYEQDLAAVGSKLVVVSVGEEVHRQLEVAGVIGLIGPDGIYEGGDNVGEATGRAYADARAWVTARSEAER